MVVKHGPFQMCKSVKIFERILRKLHSSVQGEGVWWMRCKYELNYLSKEPDSCYDEGFKDEMAWACHKDG